MNLKPKKIAALDHTTPARRRVRRMLDDGSEVIERVPWQRCLKAVNPAGAVVRIPLHTHRVNNEVHDPYKVYQETNKVQKGFLPYGVCPQTLPWDVQQAHIPASLRGKQPCREAKTGGRISADACCACLEDIIEFRKAAQAEKMRKVEITTDAMLQAEASRTMAGAVKEMAQAVSELRVAKEPAKRTARSTDD